MTKEKLKIPGYALDPLFGILHFNWFLFILRSMLKNNDLNVYILYDMKYKELRKKQGIFLSSMHKKKLVDVLVGFKDINLIGDCDKTKIIFISEKDITKEIQEEFKKENINITLAASASIESDNEFTLVNRVFDAISLALAGKEEFRRL